MPRRTLSTSQAPNQRGDVEFAQKIGPKRKKGLPWPIDPSVEDTFLAVY